MGGFAKQRAKFRWMRSCHPPKREHCGCDKEAAGDSAPVDPGSRSAGANPGEGGPTIGGGQTLGVGGSKLQPCKDLVWSRNLCRTMTHPIKIGEALFFGGGGEPSLCPPLWITLTQPRGPKPLGWRAAKSNLAKILCVAHPIKIEGGCFLREPTPLPPPLWIRWRLY